MLNTSHYRHFSESFAFYVVNVFMWLMCSFYEMARSLKRGIRISSEMATDAKRWSVMVKNIDNGDLGGKIRKRLVLGEHYKVLYSTGFILGMIFIDKCQFFYPFFIPLVGLMLWANSHLKLLALVIPYSGNTILRYGQFVFGEGVSPYYLGEGKL